MEGLVLERLRAFFSSRTNIGGRPAEKAVAGGLWAQHVERTVSGGAPAKRPLDQKGRLPIEGKERDNNRTRIGWPADKPGVPPGFRVLLLVRAGCWRTGLA